MWEQQPLWNKVVGDVRNHSPRDAGHCLMFPSEVRDVATRQDPNDRRVKQLIYNVDLEIRFSFAELLSVAIHCFVAWDRTDGGVSELKEKQVLRLAAQICRPFHTRFLSGPSTATCMCVQQSKNGDSTALCRRMDGWVPVMCVVRANRSCSDESRF